MITRYVPHFISENYKHNILKGSFTGYTIFFDIVNFSEITAKKAVKGRKEASEIYSLLQNTFGIPISIISQNKGIVAGFSGDAFTAVFPDIASFHFFRIVLEINNLCNKKKSSRKHEMLNARIFVGYGEIKWRIIENPIKNEFFFSGNAINECCNLPHNEYFLLFTKSAASQIGLHYFNKYVSACYPKNIELNKINYHSNILPKKIEENTLFEQIRYRNLTLENEIRDTACCFISLNEIDTCALENTLDIILSETEKFELYFNKLDFSDKGLIAVVLAGAPTQQEKGLKRIVDFARYLIADVETLKIGLCRGKCYAGFTGSKEFHEYSVLGFTPNLAVRLMQRALPGSILVDRFTQEQLIDKFDFSFDGKINVPGFASAIPIFKFLGEKNIFNVSTQLHFFGRTKEKKEILDAYNSFLNNNTISIYVHGNAGIGKTALIDSVRSSIPADKVVWCIMACDVIFSNPYTPIIRYLRSLFMVDMNSNNSRKKTRFLQLWKEITGNAALLDKIKPTIADFIGINLCNSALDVIPPSAKPEFYKKALLQFFTFLAKSNILILNIDDAQWIDDKTKIFLQELASVKDIKLLIISSCRYKKNGDIVNLQIPVSNNIDIYLQRLPVKIALQLAESILQIEYIPQDTEQFIISKSQCNPLFVEQIAWFIKEKGLIDNNGFLNADIEYINTFEIADVIGSRIDSLTDKLKKLVSYASVLGMEFNISVLSAMMKNRVGDDLSKGETQKLWNKLNNYEYIFTHILLRDTIYSRMLDKKQKELHKLAAICYENLYHKKELEEFFHTIAYHYEKAEDYDKAIDYYVKAGKLARTNFQLDEAASAFDKAYSLIGNQDDHNFIISLDIKHLSGVVKCIRGNQKDGLEIFLYVFNEYKKLNMEKDFLYSEVLKDIAIAYRELGDFDNALKYSLLEHELLNELFPQKFLQIAESFCRIATVQYLTGKYNESYDNLMKAVKILDDNNADKKNYLQAYGLIAAIYHVRNQLDKALEFNLLVLNTNINNLPEGHYEIGRNYINTGNVYSALDLHDKAMDCYMKAVRIQKNVTGNNHPRLAFLYSNIAGIFSDKNDLDKAEDYLNKALNIALDRFGENHPETADYFSSLGMVLLKKNKTDNAYELLKKSLDYREKNLGPQNPYTAMSWRNMGKYCSHSGDYDSAYKYHTKALEAFCKIYGKYHPLTLEDYEALGKYHLHKKEYKTALDYFNDSKKSIDTVQKDIPNYSINNLLNRLECNINLNSSSEIERLINEAQQVIAKIGNKKQIERYHSLMKLHEVGLNTLDKN